MKYQNLPSNIHLIPWYNVWWQGIKRMLFYLRNGLAIIGLLCIFLIFVLYQKSQESLQSFDAAFPQLLSEFLYQTLDQDITHALTIKIAVQSDVSLSQAIDAMRSQAKTLNFHLIHKHDFSPLFSQDDPIVTLTVLEFYQRELVTLLMHYTPNIAIHLPCRIILYTDVQGQKWLATLDYNLLIHGVKGIPITVKNRALQIQDNLFKVMGAGATGVK